MTFNHKSSGAWDDLKLCPPKMKPLKKYQTTPKNPNTQKPVGGEKQFGITREGAAFFYDAANNIVPSLFVYAKKDLLEYLDSSEFEYKHPSLNYCNKKFLPSMFDEKKKEILDLDEFSALNFYINIRCNDKGEGDAQYLMPCDTTSRNSYYNFLKILLSNSTQGKKLPFTCCTFFKFIDTNTSYIYFYMKPEFIKEYKMDKLAKIFDSELKGKDIDDRLNAISSQFAFKFRKQIKTSEEVNTLLSHVRNLTDKQKKKAKEEFQKVLNAKMDFWKQEVSDAQKAIEHFVKASPDESDDDNNNGKPRQKIYYGAPGTGKSYKIDDPVNGCGLKNVKNEYKFRTTFHPDYDYAQFVGAYKPRSVPKKSDQEESKKKEKENENTKNDITYDFAPQVFANAYIKSWIEFLNVHGNSNAKQTGSKKGEKSNSKSVYLVIEEINRGNCAQIFGDIFQLLDRIDGHSAYPIDIDSAFAKYIRDQLKKESTEHAKQNVDYWSEYKRFIQKWAGPNNGASDEEFCKIALPPNLIILATMNTSDQSLFPMDSAFKRRFDWEYVPIKYERDAKCDAKWNADDFVIKIKEGHTEYDWLDFLLKVNEDIENVTSSEDKKMGEFFIKPKDGVHIEFEEFRSKVLFYLWDSVYKDDEGISENPNKVFHFEVDDPKDEKKKQKLTFQMLFEGDDDKQFNLVEKIMNNLNILSHEDAQKKRNESK